MSDTYKAVRILATFYQIKTIDVEKSPELMEAARLIEAEFNPENLEMFFQKAIRIEAIKITNQIFKDAGQPL